MPTKIDNLLAKQDVLPQSGNHTYLVLNTTKESGEQTHCKIHIIPLGTWSKEIIKSSTSHNQTMS